VKTLNALGRLYSLETFSMPRYVAGAGAHDSPGDAHLLDVLQDVITHQQHLASKIAGAILLRRGRVPRATYPMEYTGLNNLELRYLFTCMLGEQRSLMDVIDELVNALRQDESAQQVAREVRRQETAHLRVFEEICLRYPPAASRKQAADMRRWRTAA